MKKRILVSLYLNKMNRSEKVNQGRATHDAITASTHFPVSAEKTALLLALLTATDNLEQANADTESGSHESYAAADVAELQYDMAYRNIAYYVQTKADAQPALAEEIILSAAMKIKKASVKMKAPTPLNGLRAKVTGDATSIKLRIDTDNPRSTHYEILMTSTPDVDNSWVSIADITARKFLVEGLENGTRYFFKARAINSISKSIYSDVVSQVAA